MAKTNLERWHELQNANVSNSTGYMNEFVSSENPLRTGNHVFTEIADVEPNSNRIQRMSGDSGGVDVISLEEFRSELLSGRGISNVRPETVQTVDDYNAVLAGR